MKRELDIEWLESGGIKTNGKEHYLPPIPDDQREYFTRVLLRVFNQGKEVRSAEIKYALEGKP